MTNGVVRLTSAAAIAVGLAWPFVMPVVAGVATWKVVLAVIGVVLFGLGSRRDPAPTDDADRRA